MIVLQKWKGRVHLQFHIAIERRSLLMTHWYHQHLGRKLFYMGQMTEHNYKLVFENKGCLIMDKLNKETMVARGEMTEDRIFKLSFDSRNSQSLNDGKFEKNITRS